MSKSQLVPRHAPYCLSSLESLARPGNQARISRCMRNQVSARTLADLLGVSEKVITQLAKRGVVAPAPKGRYHLQASVYSYCAFLRAMIGHTAEVESSEEPARE